MKKPPLRFLLGLGATMLGAVAIAAVLVRRLGNPCPPQAPPGPSPRQHLLSAAYRQGWTRADLERLTGSGPDATAIMWLPGTSVRLELRPDTNGGCRVNAILREGHGHADIPAGLESPGIGKSQVLQILKNAGII